MEVRKVERVKPPAYPDKEASLRDPTLLLNTPERWKRNAAACAALAATSAMLLVSCGGDKSVLFFDRGQGRIRAEIVIKNMIMTTSMGVMPHPIPTFTISEDEAYSIINMEAGKAGISFISSDEILKNIQLPIFTLNKKGFEVFKGYEDGTLVLDGYDEEKGIAFEFVSAKDALGWLDGNAENRQNAILDIRMGAKALAKGLEGKTGDTMVAVFYDPAIENRDLIKEYPDYTETENKIRDNLRAQVRDFIAWLKAQGII